MPNLRLKAKIMNFWQNDIRGNIEFLYTENILLAYHEYKQQKCTKFVSAKNTLRTTETADPTELNTLTFQNTHDHDLTTYRAWFSHFHFVP